MQIIIEEIRSLTQLLAGLRADNIVVEHLHQILTRLKDSDLSQKLEQFKRIVPSEAEGEEVLEQHREEMKKQSDILNKEADGFLDELDRIKRMRQTLNLEALDPLIKEARRIIHSIHGFTANLQEDS